MKNQCDGCNAGIPIVNGNHRMGKEGGYPDLQGCTAKLYKVDAAEERKAGINDLMDVLRNGTQGNLDTDRYACELIYDAGYRKFEIVEDDV